MIERVVFVANIANVEPSEACCAILATQGKTVRKLFKETPFYLAEEMLLVAKRREVKGAVVYLTWSGEPRRVRDHSAIDTYRFDDGILREIYPEELVAELASIDLALVGSKP